MGMIVRISPTVFNFLSDLLGLFISEFLYVAIQYSYQMLMTWHLKIGKFIPFDHLGGGSLSHHSFTRAPQAFTALRHSDFRSWVVYLLIGLAVIADYSHPFSDLALKFTKETVRSGKDETVLNLRKKNEEYLYQVVGDPYSLRTKAFISGDNEKHIEVSANFMTAVDNIAQGVSPFLTDGFEFKHVNEGLMGGVSTLYLDSSSPIASIPELIPLNNCTTSSSRMMRIEQSSSFYIEGYAYNDTFVTTAKVPECTFDRVRESGIYKEDKRNRDITITSYAQIYTILNKGKVIAPLINENYNSTFFIPRSYRAIARDTSNWKTGRDISGWIDGFQIGFLRIKFESVVFAAIAESVPIPKNIGSATRWDPLKEYIFVGKVEDGRCPAKATGYSASSSESCIVTFTASCEPFTEDVVPLPPAIDDVRGTLPDWNQCISTDEVDIVWGERFEVDEEFIAAVAGIYSRSKLLEHRSVTGPIGVFGQKVLWQSILAAKFAMGALDERESTKLAVRAEIGAGWLVLTFFPVFLGIILFITAFIHKRSCGKNGIGFYVPIDPWQLMMVGKEDDDIVPVRDSCIEKFPKRPQGLQYGVVNDVELRLISKPKPFLSLRKSAEDVGPAKVHKESDDDSSEKEEPFVPPKVHKESDDDSSKEEEPFVPKVHKNDISSDPQNEHEHTTEPEISVVYEDMASISGSDVDIDAFDIETQKSLFDNIAQEIRDDVD